MKMRLNRSTRILANLIIAAAIILSTMIPMGTAKATPFVQTGIPKVHPLDPIGGAITYASSDHPRALPLFHWEEIPGATKYQVEVNTAPDFQGVALWKLTTQFTYWAPEKANLPDRVTLYWRVKVKTMAGVSGEGPEGDPETFQKDWTRLGPSTYNTTTLLLPANNAYIDYTDPEGDLVNRPAFSWTPVMGATYYVLQFSKDDTFAPASIAQAYTTMNTNYQLINKIQDGQYWWRVVPFQDGMPAPGWDGAPSAYRVINFNYHSANLPTLLAPDNNAQPEFTPTFRWTPVRGAEHYYFEISTDPLFAGVVPIATHGTSYTPTSPLQNNQDYFWRVRVASGNSLTKIYSETRKLRKMWYRQPVLLTPTNGYMYATDPFFTWTPVPGASSYRIEVDYFNPIRAAPANKGTTTNTFFAFSSKNYNCPPWTSSHGNRVFWQVTAIDANGNDGGKSLVASFDCVTPAVPPVPGPVQVYPFFYYPSLTDPVMNPREDRTVPIPIFAWKRVLNGTDETQALSYRIQVANQPNIELHPGAIKYTLDTENMNAIPNLSSLMPHGNGQTDYYWRVCQLTAAGACYQDTYGNNVWSQEWRMRFNPALLPQPTATIQPLRPTQGSEWVETLPLFEWMPLQNATSYQIQISDNAAFTTAIGTYSVDYPAYSHPQRLASGTYYWRVCGITSGNPVCESNIPADWSTPVRFQVAAQSRWRLLRTFGSNNAPVIATDPVGDAGTANYDLSTLSITQGGANWYFGFNANTDGVVDKKYAIYIDTDHKDNSGGTSDPEGYNITTIGGHQPEYVVYLYQVGGVFSKATSLLYTWNQAGGPVWNTPYLFSQLAGADILYNSITGYLEIVLPGSLIGQTDTVSSVAVSVLSVANTGGGPRDSVPSDPNVYADGRAAVISRFASATDRINLIYPFQKTDNDPKLFTTVPPVFWQPPVEVPGTLFFETRIGLDMDTIDPNNMTTVISDALFNNPAEYTFLNDVRGDETSYYWQIRPWYGTNGPQGGWSQVNRFQRKGQPVQGLAVTYDQWTPTFNWNMAEGGFDYYIQIDDDPGFTSPYVDSATTRMNSYTPNDTTFVDGKVYYARIQLGRTALITNDFSDPIQFTVQRPTVTGLVSIPPNAKNSPAPYNPTFCWNPIPSAYAYYLQIGWDDAFQTPYYHYLTEQSCFTGPEGREDGEFSWRVWMIDGSGKEGPPSNVLKFWKYYPVPTLIFPTGPVAGTPVFKWSGVDSAESYELQISKDPEFNNIKYKITTVNNWHQPTAKLNFGDFYWRVRIIDRDGKYGGYSNYIYIQYYKSFLPAIRK